MNEHAQPAPNIEALEAAIFRHQAMPVHAHEQPPQSMDHQFVTYGDVLRQLDTAAWRLVLGSRGAGKTHLLRVFQERSLRGAIAERDAAIHSLPVYVDARAFASTQFADDDERRAHASFRDFLEMFGDRLMIAVGALDSRRGLYALLRHPKRKSAADQALTLVRNLTHELDCSRFTYPWVVEMGRETHSESTKAKDAGSLEGGIGVGPLGASGKAKGNVERERIEETARERSRAVQEQSQPRWRRLGEMIAELCEALEIERIDILIDNWTALDSYGNSLVQPHFAQLLKQSLGGSHRISVKIAAEALSTRLWDPDRAIGLQRPHDIDLLVSLDKPLLDDTELIKFFEELLFRRLLSCEANLSRYVDPDKPGLAISPHFVEDLFGDRSSFELLVRGTEGRMRLFLQCLRQLAHGSNFRLTEPWTEEQVLAVVQSRANYEVEDLQYLSPAVRMLQTQIKPQIIAKDNPTFSVSREGYSRFETSLQELVSKGLLERTISTLYGAHFADGLIGFKVSSELMSEWDRALTFEQEVQHLLNEDRSPSKDSLSLDELKIDLHDEP